GRPGAGGPHPHRERIMDPVSEPSTAPLPTPPGNPAPDAAAGGGDDLTGRTLGDYRLLRRLGQGGMGQVYLAEQVSLRRKVALKRASESGIIHRDIKPENILLTRKAEVKVADFGLSRVLAGEGPPVSLTQSGVTMGTPLYMSPEQVEGKPLDCRTDIYSFGVTCYHMLAGQPPFRGETAFEVALQHVRAEPEPLGKTRPDLPEVLCKMVHKMMIKDP